MRRTVACSFRRRRVGHLLRLLQGLSLLLLTIIRFQFQSRGEGTPRGTMRQQQQRRQFVPTFFADALAGVGGPSPSATRCGDQRRTASGRRCSYSHSENWSLCSRVSQRRRKVPETFTCRSTTWAVPCFSSSSSAHEFGNIHRADSQQHCRNEPYEPILELLQRHNYQARLRTIDARQDLPMYAEAFLQGTSKLVRIVRIVAEPAAVGAATAAANDTSLWTALKEPKAVVQIIPDDGLIEARSASTSPTVVVDLAQITSVFFRQEIVPTASQRLDSNSSSSGGGGSGSAIWGRGSDGVGYHHSQARAPYEVVNGRALERALDQLYGSRVGRGRSVKPSSSSSSSSSGLSKKQVHAVVQQLFTSSSVSAQDLASDGASGRLFTYPSPNEAEEHAEYVLRQAVKIGAGSSRLVDSIALCISVGLVSARRSQDRTIGKRMNGVILRDIDNGAPDTKSIQWAGRALATDAQMGGRFKRWPCVIVGCTATPNRSEMEEEAPVTTTFASRSSEREVAVASICILNGGWLAVDQSVRAGAEARKFVERRTPTAPPSLSKTAMKVDTDTTHGAAEAKAPPGALERPVRTQADVRIIQRLECLAMGEDLSSATDCLELDVRETLNTMNLPLSPSGAKQALMQAGWWTRDIRSEHSRVEPWSSTVLEAASWYLSQRASIEREMESCYKTRRVDLTRYPCLCIDAQRTKFRDDALGLRPRAETGRRIVPGASKWEVLVHIVDVGDIYTMHHSKSLRDDDKLRLSLLKDASKSRGCSRYDLPLGPLHLMPPRVLEALSFSQKAARQRCLTLWAYVDERDGNLVDFGLERTLVRTPVMLSYGEASGLLETPHLDHTIDPKERSLLLVLNRLLSRWSETQTLSHVASQRRQERLLKRHLEGKGGSGFNSLGEDDGGDGFKRSSAHRMVDSALELYSTGVSSMLRNAGAPIPQAKGAESFRGGRVATAPLRRYVDGEAQRQILAVLFHQGRRISARDCAEIGRVANLARNSIANVRAARKS